MTRLLFAAAAAALLHTPTAAGAEAAADYPQKLALVYGAYQRILTLRDACAAALPAQKAEADKAYAAWKARNQKVLDEIDQHVTALIKRQSADARDYARNIGRYEGERLKEREEGKQAFLSLPRAEVEQLCRELPKTLASRDTDLEVAYAEELKTVRSRR